MDTSQYHKRKDSFEYLKYPTWYFSGTKIKNPLQPIDCKGLCLVERGGIETPSLFATALYF